MEALLNIIRLQRQERWTLVLYWPEYNLGQQDCPNFGEIFHYRQTKALDLFYGPFQNLRLSVTQN